MERVLVFGAEKNLVGICSEPAAGANGLPGVVLLNAGLLHRVGPYRLYVELARGLAELGFSVLRFDAAGLGDSVMPRDSRDYAARSRDDIIAALDYLEKNKGIKAFVLMGLCSGADNAHAVAAVDERVAGVVMMDGFTYPTLGFYLRDYAPYMVNPVRLAWFIVKTVFRAIKGLAPTSFGLSQGGKDAFDRNFPPRARVAEELGEMADRGVRMLYIYSGGIAGYYNYAEQFTDMFKQTDFKGRLRLEYLKEANHTYTSISMRRKLMEIIFDWFHENYAANVTKAFESKNG